MRYDVMCITCGKQEAIAPMSVSDYAECPVCERPRPKAISLFQFTEDRLRLWSGPMGNGYSTALGEQMPATRSERDRLAKKKGVEFVSKAELLADSHEARDAVQYTEHVRSGGRPDAWSPVDTSHFKPTPDWAKPLLGG